MISGKKFVSSKLNILTSFWLCFGFRISPRHLNVFYNVLLNHRLKSKPTSVFLTLKPRLLCWCRGGGQRFCDEIWHICQSIWGTGSPRGLMYVRYCIEWPLVAVVNYSYNTIANGKPFLVKCKIRVELQMTGPEIDRS